MDRLVLAGAGLAGRRRRAGSALSYALVGLAWQGVVLVWPARRFSRVVRR